MKFFVSFFTLLPMASATTRIASSFVDKTYRIERHFVPEEQARSLLLDLVQDGIPQHNETFTKESLKVMGDAGDQRVKQHEVEDYESAIQTFVTQEHDETSSQESLIYYLEQLSDSPLYRSNEMIQKIAPNSVLEDGGTVHLYMSSPGAAALGNHTDTTDIVVLQLEGEKEWLLCSQSEAVQKEETQDEHSFFSSKLDSCSTYSGLEFENLDCERKILHPGDALFLPRRVVHSARALSDQFSAHLTFGFNEDDFCWNYGQETQAKLRTLKKKKKSSSSDSSDDSETKSCLFGVKCDTSCDRLCTDGCDRHCDQSCDKFFVLSCDRFCDSSCDKNCLAECDSSCDCILGV